MDFLQLLGVHAGSPTPASTALLVTLYGTDTPLPLGVLCTRTEVPRTSANRELKALVAAGLVSAQQVHGHATYRANRDHALYPHILGFLALTHGVTAPTGRTPTYDETNPRPYVVDYQWEHRYPPHLIDSHRTELPGEEYTGPSTIQARIWARELGSALGPIGHLQRYLQSSYREFHVERDRDLIHYVQRLIFDPPHAGSTLVDAADIAQRKGNTQIGALAFDRARLDLHLTRERLTAATALMHRYAQARLDLDAATIKAARYHRTPDKDIDQDGNRNELVDELATTAEASLRAAHTALERLPRWGGASNNHRAVGLAGERILWTLLDTSNDALELLAREWDAHCTHPVPDLDPTTPAGFDRMLTVIAERASPTLTGLPAPIERDIPDENTLIQYARHHATNPPALPDHNNNWWPMTYVADLDIGTRIPVPLNDFHTNPDYQWEAITAITLTADATIRVTTATSSSNYNPYTAIPTEPPSAMDQLLRLRYTPDIPL